MEEKSYFDERLDPQIKWYDDKSAVYKKRFHWLKIGTMILGASIPVLTGFVPIWMGLLRVVGIIGALIVVLEGLNSLWKSQEHWTRYRMISESLKHEKFMYLTSTGIYRNVEDRFADLVERTETIISSENVNWANLQSNKKNENGVDNNGK